MFRTVFTRRSRSLIELTLLLVAVAATVSAARPANGFAAATDTATDLGITETGAPATQDVFPGTPFKDITWTMVVTNNGPLDDTNVTVSDPLPNGATYVDSTTTQGTCTGGASFDCSLGTLPAGDSVTITLVTTPTVEGQYSNTPVVAGDLTETDSANNTATASVIAATCHGCGFVCTAVIVTPEQLYLGRLTTLHITVSNRFGVLPGVRVRIKGPGIFVLTRSSGIRGRITRTIKPARAGIVVFRPVNRLPCKLTRIGVTGIGAPPVTG